MSQHGVSNFCPLFDRYTKIITLSGSFKFIDELKVGDIIFNGNVITGTVKALRQNTPVFHHGSPGFSYEIRGTQGCIVFDICSKRWNPIWGERCGVYDKNYSDRVMYSIFTSDGYFNILGGLQARDYDNCPDMTTEMEVYLENKINERSSNFFSLSE